MNTILLQPTDVLFFRDGRPMSGSLAGHTTAWPLPDVTNHALHAALHRAGLEGTHKHRRGLSGNYQEQRDRRFGSLVTGGPFPVNSGGLWFFPRPTDSKPAAPRSTQVTFRPIGSLSSREDNPWLLGSLPAPLRYAVGSLLPPVKESSAEAWISRSAFESYLRSQGGPGAQDFLRDTDLADQEANLGIQIDPDSQTTGQGEAAGKIYTAHYLRLRDGYRLGLLAEASDKDFRHPGNGSDLIKALLDGDPAHIVVGGQQRTCTAVREDSRSDGLPLPRGFSQPAEFAALPNGKYALKWVLLSPAIWPEIPDKKKDGAPQNPHSGGWLPNWVDPQTGMVLLTSGAGVRKAARKGTAPGASIAARLVGAIVPKPLVVTGWALPNDTDRAEGGVKSTHLAVPAGAVYYFEAESAPSAKALADALNWHGTSPGTEVRNRRSTLLGEKGYGLGVCGTWKFFGAE